MAIGQFAARMGWHGVLLTQSTGQNAGYNPDRQRHVALVSQDGSGIWSAYEPNLTYLLAGGIKGYPNDNNMPRLLNRGHEVMRERHKDFP